MRICMKNNNYLKIAIDDVLFQSIQDSSISNEIKKKLVDKFEEGFTYKFKSMFDLFKEIVDNDKKNRENYGNEIKNLREKIEITKAKINEIIGEINVPQEICRNIKDVQTEKISYRDSERIFKQLKNLIDKRFFLTRKNYKGDLNKIERIKNLLIEEITYHSNILKNEERLNATNYFQEFCRVRCFYEIGSGLSLIEERFKEFQEDKKKEYESFFIYNIKVLGEKIGYLFAVANTIRDYSQGIGDVNDPRLKGGSFSIMMLGNTDFLVKQLKGVVLEIRITLQGRGLLEGYFPNIEKIKFPSIHRVFLEIAKDQTKVNNRSFMEKMASLFIQEWN